MPRNDRPSALFTGPSPSVRREDGIRDARLGRQPTSSDRDYAIGYDLGSRFGRAARAEDPDRAAPTSGDGR